MTNRIALHLREFEWLVRGALAAVADDPVAPILSAIHWATDHDFTTVTGTDRYRVHQLITGRAEQVPAGRSEFLMPAAMGRRLLTAAHTPRRNFQDQYVRISWTDADRTASPASGPRARFGSVSVTVFADHTPDADAVTVEGTQPEGAYPNVGRLFDKLDPTAERATDFRLRMDLLSKMQVLRSGTGSLRFTPPAAAGADGKPGVLLVKNTEGTARALIQPTLHDQQRERGWRA